MKLIDIRELKAKALLLECREEYAYITALIGCTAPTEVQKAVPTSRVDKWGLEQVYLTGRDDADKDLLEAMGAAVLAGIRVSAPSKMKRKKK